MAHFQPLEIQTMLAHLNIHLFAHFEHFRDKKLGKSACNLRTIETFFKF